MKKRILYGTKLPVLFTIKESELIRNHTFYNPDFAKLAVIEKGKVRVNLFLEDLQGYIAAEANHIEDKKLQKELDKL